MLLKKGAVEEREYQANIHESIKDRNAIVILPTGLGKTISALKVIAHILEHRGGKVLFTAPTKPLCEQHYQSIKDSFNIHKEELVLFTGEVKPELRVDQWDKARVVVSTPQTVLNDVKEGRYSLKDLTLTVFDEVHRAVKGYAYVELSQLCFEQRNGMQTLGLTASPGSDFKKIEEVCDNLRVEVVEIRFEEDPDVKPYLGRKMIEWVEIEKEVAIKEVEAPLRQVYEGLIRSISRFSNLPEDPNISKTSLLDLQARVFDQLKVTKSGPLYRLSTLIAAAIKLSHMLDLLTSEGHEAAASYAEKLFKDKSRAASMILKTDGFKKGHERLLDIDTESIKMVKIEEMLKEFLSENKDAKAIVFVQFRDTIDVLLKYLLSHGIKAVKFVGQASRDGSKGMSQVTQKEVLEQFRKGMFDVLVSSSVGEEGIDVPATGLVIFYEPVPSAIRSIQRKGRTARDRLSGRVVIFISKGSKDVAYYWKSKKEEIRMMKNVTRLNRMLKGEVRENKEKGERKKSQRTLGDFQLKV